jgi:glycosyltransferase involved in cell wall biosynthesis
MKKTKIIHIMHFSQSIKDKDYKRFMIFNWHHTTAHEISKFLNKKKFELECWRPEKTIKNAKTLIAEGINHRLFPSTIAIRYGKEISIPMIKALKNEIKKSDVILHIHEPHSWHGIIIPLLFSKQPIIGQHHGGRAPLRHLFRRWWYPFLFPLLFSENVIELFSLQKYNFIYSLNNYETKYLKRIVSKKVLKNQTMGVNSEFFTGTNKNKSRKKLNIAKNIFVILFVGSLIKRKGIQHLIDGFKKASKKIHNLQLIIVGEGPLKHKLKKQAKGYNVLFVGWKDHKEELKHYYSTADVYAHLADWEGASVSILEALYMGLSIIATPTGNAPEIIKRGETGIIIRKKNTNDIYKATLEVYKNPKKHCQLSKEISKRFNWETIAKNTINNYIQLEEKYSSKLSI